MTQGNVAAQMQKHLARGNLFEGKYRIIEFLGAGSFAIVVHARHEVMKRDVALKFLKPEVVASNPDVSARFITEVQIVSRLTNSNTVTIFDFGETAEGICYMVLEFVSGDTLDLEFKDGQGLGVERATDFCEQILASLVEAHAHGIIHRDLKPANIMVSQGPGRSDQIKVLDFGVAKLLKDAEAKATTESGRQSTQFIGTPIYMSPEQILGQSVQASSDLYSLGLILYEMLTGESPLSGESVAKVARQHLDTAALPFKSLHHLPPGFAPIILQATSRHPQDRFQSAEEFLGALRAVTRGSGPIAAIPGPGVGPAPEIAAPVGLGQESSVADVFRGKGYVDLPDVDEDMFAPVRRPTPALKEVRPKPKRVMSASQELELDLGSVRRQRHRNQRHVDLESTRERQALGRVKQRELGYVSMTSLALLMGWYASFVLLTAPMQAFAPVMRMGAGLSLLLIAVLWAGFAFVPSSDRSFARRWIWPTGRNLWTLFFVTFLGLALFASEGTASGLEENSTWFFESLPPVPPLTWLEALTHGIASTLASLFSLIHQILPW